MKRKEREHLKEDPFVKFVEKALETLKKYKKKIFLGLGIALFVVIIGIFIGFLRSHSISSENLLYSEALEIKNSKILSFDEKVKKLMEMEDKKGISSSVKLFLSTLYFEKGEIQKAKEVLDTFSESKIRLLNDEKKLLEAEIFNVSGKKKEAIDLFFKMFSDKESQISKDFVLLRMAKIKIKTGQIKGAITDMHKLTDDFPNSVYVSEAQALLRELESN